MKRTPLFTEAEQLVVAKAIAKEYGYRWSPCTDCRRKAKVTHAVDGIGNLETLTCEPVGTRGKDGRVRWTPCLGAPNLDPNDVDEVPTRESCLSLAATALTGCR